MHSKFRSAVASVDSRLALFAAMFVLALPPVAHALTTPYQAQGEVTFAAPGLPLALGQAFTLTFAIDDSKPQTRFTGSSQPLNFAGYDEAIVEPHLVFAGGLGLQSESAVYYGNGFATHSVTSSFGPQDPGFATTLPERYQDPGTAEFLDFDSFQLRLVDPLAALFEDSPPELRSPRPFEFDLSGSSLNLFWENANNGQSSHVSLRLDSLVITPEPGTGLLFGLGLVAVALARRPVR